MTYCNDAPNAQIIIRVEGKRVDLRTSFPPVGYEIKRVYEPGQCSDVNYSIFAWLFIPFNGSYQKEGVHSFTGRHVVTTVTEYLISTTYEQSDGSFRTITRAPYPTTQWALDRPYQLVPTFGVPDECGPELGCNLKVWDTKGTLWDGTYDECATVEINCGEACCPNMGDMEGIAGDIRRALQKMKQ